MLRHFVVLSLLALAALAAPAHAAPCVTDTPSLPLNVSVDIPFDCAVPEAPRVTYRPELGSVELLSGTGRPVVFRYVPHADVRGIDRFGWEAGDVTAYQYVVIGAALRLTCDAVSRLYHGPPPFVARDGQDLEIRLRCSNRVYGDRLTVEVTRPPALGTATLVDENPAPGVLHYRPHPGTTGADSVEVRVVSPVPGRTSAAFSIPISAKGPNRAPVCPPLPLTVVEVSSYRHFADLCSDPDGDPLSYGLVRSPASGEAFFGPDLVMTYRPRPGWTGSDTIEVVVGDGFSESRVNVPVEVRAAASPPPPSAPSSPPPPVDAPAALPSPPAGFVPARGVDLGADVAVWGPLGGIRLGRRARPVIAAGCRVACTVRARLRLQGRRGRTVALPRRRLQLPGGGRRVLRMRLTRVARRALGGRGHARAALTLVVRPAGTAPTRTTLDLRVALPALKEDR